MNKFFLLALLAVFGITSAHFAGVKAGEVSDEMLQKANEDGTAGDVMSYLNPEPMLVPAANETILGSWASYLQCDSRWGGNTLGTCSQTICSAGCAMTSVAMMLKTKGVSKDPGSLNTWLKSNGGYASGCNILWSSVNAFGVVVFQAKETASYSEICTGLSKGHGIIANVNNGSHWVLLTGCLGSNTYSVNDPAGRRTSFAHSEVLVEAVYH